MRILFSFLLVACVCCTKHHGSDSLTETFIADMPFTSTNTPSAVIAGQDIQSRVRLQLFSISGDVSIKELSVQEIAPKQYDIHARALFENWHKYTDLPVVLTIDTTVKVKTIVPGKYILRFYNNTQLFKADTVTVN